MNKEKEIKLYDLEIMQDPRFGQSCHLRLDGEEIWALECHLYLRGNEIPVAEITMPIRSIKAKCRAKVEMLKEKNVL